MPMVSLQTVSMSSDSALSVWRAYCWRSLLAKRYGRLHADRERERIAAFSDHAQSFCSEEYYKQDTSLVDLKRCVSAVLSAPPHGP